MSYGLKQLVLPQTEPLELQEVKDWLREDQPDQDGVIKRLIRTARRFTENYLAGQLISSTWQLSLDRFPSMIAINSTGFSFQDYQGFQGPSQGAGQGNWQWTLDGKTIRLPRPPLQSVVSITYVDNSGNPQVLDPSSYQVISSKVPGLITPAYAVIWPIARAQLEAVKVQFVCGYGDNSNAIPDTVKQAMLFAIDYWYANRGSAGDLPDCLAGTFRDLVMTEWSGEYVPTGS